MIVYWESSGAIECDNGSSAKQVLQRMYVDICHNYMLDITRTKQICLQKVRTENVLVKFMTKTIKPAQFMKKFEKIKLNDVIDEAHNNDKWSQETQ